tara:strand:- start:694 stop:1041 length:348 start_codon:yes stop_codon:yes gene_type:complete
MEAKELRIGNWIKYNFKMQGWNDVQVCANDFHNGFRDDKFVSINYKPIPLTEEWLVKFGFEKLKGWDDMFYFEIDDFQIYEYNVSGYEYDDFNIKNVHQLQNLYFALTNEELTIK